MTDHPIQGLMKTAMENIKGMIDVNTIVGDPVETPDGSVIMPISKIGVGFAAGGSEFNSLVHNGAKDAQSSPYPFGGGSGGGLSITPIAFLVVGAQGVNLLSMDRSAHVIEKLIELIPTVVDNLQPSKKDNNHNQSSFSNDDTPKM
ncbi:sporulation protein YtfJ [Paenibacillus albiflavus]|uniref:Sporulation protein YtfJ n=1 Tax=Paenibacillus albiflavus TaxID=2545760 RepID=A0A4R4EP60_9BACL|nr:GerW family sporulation protein [Paenibacillus albiflavus]TCZ81260.1 sporulation protein YtfJ [Paenibacillus albiflavus]